MRVITFEIVKDHDLIWRSWLLAFLKNCIKCESKREIKDSHNISALSNSIKPIDTGWDEAIYKEAELEDRLWRIKCLVLVTYNFEMFIKVLTGKPRGSWVERSGTQNWRYKCKIISETSYEIGISQKIRDVRTPIPLCSALFKKLGRWRWPFWEDWKKVVSREEEVSG